MFFVYLLISQKDRTHYIGQTNDYKSRLIEHNDGKIKSTKNKRPWNLVKYESYKTRSEARWREYTLKHNSNERKKFYGA